MALNKPSGGAALAAAIAFLVGASGGYVINEVIRSDHETDLEHEVDPAERRSVTKDER
ncbi:hypothetical protein [Rhizobium bangladeshense]|uniref:hypothetical protein n=1 Tax=Rhizobium bangladeshense TaxID=1138189 RepID=UPI002180B3B2|nr:hypothetical protein [Rhizobium bangladeshense]